MEDFAKIRYQNIKLTFSAVLQDSFVINRCGKSPLEKQVN